MGVGLAFWAGTRVSRPGGPEPRAQAPRGAAERPLLVAASGGLTRDDIRAVVREELAARAEDAEAAATLASVPADPSAPETLAALAAATAAVADGIDRGVWGARERHALRLQLPHLDADQTHEVLGPLFRAINAQKLKLDGPPI